MCLNVFECVQMYLGYECLGSCMTVYAENECNSAVPVPSPDQKGGGLRAWQFSPHFLNFGNFILVFH